jgi:ATP-binding protein involved in chromosome partitioning
MITQNDIKSRVEACLHPLTRQPLSAYKALHKVELSTNGIKLSIQLGYPVQWDKATLEAAIAAELAVLTQLPITVEWLTAIPPYKVQTKTAPKSGIKNIIAVASGKGGVGKSTIAANLALALAQLNCRVGLLDADIYGPSIPTLFNTPEKAAVVNHKIQPIMRYGVQMISIGALIDADNPVIWRGPMVSGALLQLLEETDWLPMDYLILDLPPGTGDIQLTMAQKLPVTASVVVTTPQELAQIDATKAIAMMQKVQIPVLGIVENMHHFQCDHCDTKHLLFGEGAAATMAAKFDVPVLAQLPLTPEVQTLVEGMPAIVSDPDSKLALSYRELALAVSRQLALQARDYSANIPKIVLNK